MNRRKLKSGWLPLILVPLILGSCEFQSYEEYGIKPYDGVLTFTEVNKKADWKNRFDHAAVAYNGKLWVLGGYNPGAVIGDTYYEDVWSSADGETWELVTDSAAWLGRRGHKVVAFDDGSGEAMYLIGGFSVDESTGYRQYCNDVWRSTDGENWTELVERSYPDTVNGDTLFPRMDHAAVVARHGGQDYIYVIGGRTQLEDHSGTYAQVYFSDVWRSPDGIDWEKLENNNYGRRASHAAAVDPETGTIYIQGGKHGIIFEEEGYTSLTTKDWTSPQPSKDWLHLWSTTDGVNWTSSYDSIVEVLRDTIVVAAYTQRSEHEMAFFDNTLWVLPGGTTSSMHYQIAESYHYPIWRVDEGGLWSIDSKGSDLKGRHSYATVVFNDKIWFLGGFTSNRGQENDVWSAEK